MRTVGLQATFGAKLFMASEVFFRDVLRIYRSEFGKVRDTTRDQIEKILTADQREEFHKMMAERARRRQAHRVRYRSNKAE